MLKLFFKKFSDKRKIINQVKNYNDLPFHKSYRGHLVIYFISVAIISLLTPLWTEKVDIFSTLFGLSLYVPIIFLAFKGYKNIFPLLLCYGLYDQIFTAFFYNRFSYVTLTWSYLMFFFISRAWVVLNHGIKKKILPFKKTIFIPIIYISSVIIALLALYGSFLPDETETKPDLERLKTSVVNVFCNGNNKSSGGSGFLFTDDGLILTNSHVIPQDSFGLLIDKCLVILPDPSTGEPKEIYNAKPILLESFKENDVAFLSIISAFTDEKGVPYGSFPRKFTAYNEPAMCLNKKLQLGESIKIYGYPSINGGYNLTITEGVISSFLSGGNIMTSAKISKGNSGGMAVTDDGCLVGIPSASLSSEHETYGVIIPIQEIAKMLDKRQ